MDQTVYAETTSYVISSEIKNKSEAASVILGESARFAPSYKKHGLVYVFASDEYTAQYLLGVSRVVYESLSNDLCISALKKNGIPFVVFAIENSLWESFPFPQGGNAFYLPGHNEIYIRLNSSQKKEIATSLAHELTHLLIDNIHSKIPLWFHEGMATYQMERLNNQKQMNSMLYLDKESIVAAMHNQSFTLSEYVELQHYPRHERLFYEVSYQLIRFIALKGNLNQFSNYYLHQQRSFINALKSSINYSFVSYEYIDNEFFKFIQSV
jgi:hypothetical protein